MRLTIIFLVLLCSISLMFAGGFQINEHGAKAQAMGGAFTGLADDASAAYFNPAAITGFSEQQFMAGFTLIKPSASFRGPSPSITQYDLEDQYFNPINFYYINPGKDKHSWGLSLNNPYGMGTKWDEYWPGRYAAINTALETYYLTAVYAYQLNDELSLAVGPSLVYGNVTLEKKKSLHPFTGDATIELTGDALTYSFVASAFYKYSEKLSAGLTYRHSAKLKIDGTVESEAPEAMLSMLPDGDAEAEITPPWNLTLGIGVKPIDKLTLTADMQFVGWSTYDELKIEFSQPDTFTVAPKKYNNTFIARMGAEYQVDDRIAVRGGLLYDNNPVDDEYVDPTLPDSDRLGFSTGFGFKINEKTTIDFAYLYLRFDERKIDNSKVSYTDGDAPFNGVYNSTAHLFALNMSYTLGGK